MTVNQEKNNCIHSHRDDHILWNHDSPKTKENTMTKMKHLNGNDDGHSLSLPLRELGPNLMTSPRKRRIDVITQSNPQKISNTQTAASKTHPKDEKHSRNPRTSRIHTSCFSSSSTTTTTTTTSSSIRQCHILSNSKNVTLQVSLQEDMSCTDFKSSIQKKDCVLGEHMYKSKSKRR